MKNIIDEKQIFSGEELLTLGKQGNITESFVSKNNEEFCKVDGKLCYISKAARESFANCKVSELQVVEITTKDDETEEVSSFLRLQKAGFEPAQKQGDWQ